MKTAYVVLGPHRSGTSSVAGVFALLGATPPKTLLEPSQYNPKGYWESERIMKFGDEILSGSGSSWHDWRPLTLAEEHEAAWHEAAKWVLHVEYSQADVIVLKDPRICRLYPFWEKALLASGYEPAVICPVRSPLECAASLERRKSGSGFLHGLRIWLSHSLDAEFATRGKTRHFMQWTSFLDDWTTQLSLASQRFGHNLMPSDPTIVAEIDAFLSQDLRHQVETDLKSYLSPISLIEKTYQALKDLTTLGERPEIHARLDAVRAEFAMESRLFIDAP